MAMSDVSFGFYNTSGSAWFDEIQLEKALKPEDGYNLSGFNTVENGGFEKGL